MGGLTSAVHWWEESQLRILVLSSMAIQVLLLIFSSLRRFAIPRWARTITWLAYLAGDAVAIYALATLFNRHKDKDHQGGDSDYSGRPITPVEAIWVDNNMLEVIWAPVLLLHLGGHDGITAYNIEDNELWSRHLLTAVSQVTVAIYVFCKSWPQEGNIYLLLVGILLFVPGVLKCFHKPWALKSASIYNLVSSAAVVEQNEIDMYPLEEYVKRAKEFVNRDQQELPPRHKGPGSNVVDHLATPAAVEDEDHSPSQGLLCAQPLELLSSHRRKTRHVKRMNTLGKLFEELDRTLGKVVKDELGRFPSHGKQELEVRRAILKRLRVLGEASYKLFVDLSSPYPHRLSILEYCWGITEGRVYGYVKRGLATAFFLLYTKIKTAGFSTELELGVELKHYRDQANIQFRLFILVARLVLPLVSIGLFHMISGEFESDNDVYITYSIYYCTAVLEMCSALPILFGQLNSMGNVFSSSESLGRWPEMVAQYSLIGYFASNKKHSKWMCIADTFGCKDFVNQRILCMEPCSSSARISRLVLGYLKDGWKKEIHDAPSYRRFNDHSTHWPVLLGYLEEDHHVGFSSSMRKRAFDASVLLWHIATDFCFFLSLAASSEHKCGSADSDCSACKVVRCREMSNYMVYLLFVNPEMLLPGTRRNLFIDAYYGLNHILKDMDMDMDIPMGRKPTNVKKDEWVMQQRVINTMQRRHRAKKSFEPCPGEEPKKVSPPEEEGSSSSKEKSTKKTKGGFSKEKLIDNAWALAQRLLDKNKGDDKKMWEEIQRVWVEMLCFSASRCRGYLHAKALGEGGEFLSYVWLTLFHMGMETFTDKLQREEPPRVSHERSDNGNAPPPSTYCEVSTSITAPSTSMVHAGAGAVPLTYEICCVAEDDMV